jgi:dsRNA-specific ribonuclease
MDERSRKDLAWIGDAVLGLFVRQWLLNQPENPPFSRQDRFIRFTSNAFLSSFGEPTEVEARIGRIYLESGLLAAFAHIEEEMLPRHKAQLDKAARSMRGAKGSGTGKARG